jgi:hypothetical protein
MLWMPQPENSLLNGHEMNKAWSGCHDVGPRIDRFVMVFLQ